MPVRTPGVGQQDSLLIGGDHDVGRFDAAVQHSTIVHMVLAAKPISTDTQGELEQQRRRGDQRRQCESDGVLHVVTSCVC
jgi:hypothetical protein